jgi:hypothetical protein
VGLPLALAAAWAVFRAAGDGPRPPVVIPGIARLALELCVLGGAAAALYAGGHPHLAAAMAFLVLIDFAASYDRVARLTRATGA